MSTRTWDMRQTQSEEKWENARPHLLESMLSAEWTLDQSCDHCHTKRAVIRCRDCLPKHLFCSDCDLAVHQNYVLHNRDSVVEGFYKALPPTCSIVQDGSGAHQICEQACLLPIASPLNLCNCDTKDIAVNAGRAIILVTINGEFAIPWKRVTMVVFWTFICITRLMPYCNESFVSTGRYDLLLPLVTCKSCFKSWTPGLKDLQSNGYWPGNVDFQTVYSTDVFHTFEEFKVSAPGLSRQAFVKMLDNRTSNFGRAGRISGDSFQRCFLEWTYCRHEKEKLLAVDHFSCPACMEDIAAISVDGNRKMYHFNRTKGYLVEVCGKSQWTAARETAKKSGSKVDEEGVEVAVCRHGILFKALNMFRGEIYAYPLFLQKEVALGHNIQFFCTDIMCKYYPYLQKVCEAFADLVPLLQMKPFLSVMHAKGYSGKCEVQWGGRNQEGAGMTVGEEVEQVNSFLSRVGLTTKYMTKSARTDMITLQARGWNLRKKSNLHKYLSQRYVKITKRTREMEQEVEALKVELGKTEEELQQWVTDVKDWAAATPNDISPDDAPGLQRVMEGLALSIQQKKMDKYRQTDSNKARQRIQSKIEKDKKKLSQAMDFYNRLVSAEDAVGPVDIILAAECPLWPWDKDSDVPLKEKKAVFDKVMLLRRLKEEDGILLKEMQQHWQFLCRCSRRLQELKGMGK
ncbi:hypothetical protein N1851_034058 [Merluccius polli]|uniref:CxC3 like cysteine cluster domain-containing protein n=1 Tax=Merluccius polli TaxID=89951 RepID=A0AA47NLS7_MERPO|nr:hypothetical protein N1851_034058 [Merluccius polli]